MANGKLYMTVGAARSGKSSFANNWRTQPNRVIVCGDDIRKALHGERYKRLAEGMVFAIKHVMIRALLSRGFDVLVDGTHTTERSIRHILEIDKNATPIPILTPEYICIERAIQTGQEDLIPVIQRHQRKIDKVLHEYGTYENLVEHLRSEI